VSKQPVLQTLSVWLLGLAHTQARASTHGTTPTSSVSD